MCENRFDAEQLQSVSTFCAGGELSADSSLARARMASSRLLHLHHVLAAVDVTWLSKRKPARSEV